MDALVTDGGSRAAVACVRALGAAGLRVLAGGPSPWAAALWSRRAAGRARLAAGDDPAFAGAVLALAERHGPLVVHPGQEEAVGPLEEAADRLPAGTVLAFGGAGRLRDKAVLADLATAAGLHAPALLAAGPAGQVLRDLPPAPAVVKAPGLSAALPAARVAEDRAALRALLAALPAGEPVLVQERVAGALLAVSLVVDREGRVVARLQQEARRLWPPDAGASSAAVTVAPDPALVAACGRVLAGAGFWGMAQLQLLRGPGGPVLIDVNPRAYGSLPLALAAGVNLPAAAHAVARGERLPAPPPYRTGVAYRWLEGDLHAARRGLRAHLRRPGGRPVAGAMWAAADPLPGALLAAQVAWAPAARRLRRR